jgi:hypothetical protein
MSTSLEEYCDYGRNVRAQCFSVNGSLPIECIVSCVSKAAIWPQLCRFLIIILAALSGRTTVAQPSGLSAVVLPFVRGYLGHFGRD